MENRQFSAFNRLYDTCFRCLFSNDLFCFIFLCASMLFAFDRSEERRLVSAIRARDETAYTSVVEVLRPSLIY